MPEKKCIFMSLGFDTSHVMKAFAEYDLHSGDKFIFITPQKEHKRAKSSKEDIQSLIENFRSRGVKLESTFYPVDEKTPKKMIMQLAQQIKQYSDYQIYIEASGGLRAICIGLYITSSIFKDQITHFASVLETTGQKIFFPLFHLPITLSKALQEDLLAFKEVKKATSLSTLKNYTGKAISTLSRQLKTLNEYGLVQREQQKPATYRLTLAGKLWLLKKDE